MVKRYIESGIAFIRAPVKLPLNVLMFVTRGESVHKKEAASFIRSFCFIHVALIKMYGQERVC